MPRSGRGLPARYVFRIEGHLDGHWSAWFDDLEVEHQADGTTTLVGVVQDQAQLHGLLAKVRDLGVTLLQLDVVEEPDSLRTVTDGVAGVSSREAVRRCAPR